MDWRKFIIGLAIVMFILLGGANLYFYLYPPL